MMIYYEKEEEVLPYNSEEMIEFLFILFHFIIHYVQRRANRFSIFSQEKYS